MNVEDEDWKDFQAMYGGTTKANLLTLFYQQHKELKKLRQQSEVREKQMGKLNYHIACQKDDVIAPLREKNYLLAQLAHRMVDVLSGDDD